MALIGKVFCLVENLPWGGLEPTRTSTLRMGCDALANWATLAWLLGSYWPLYFVYSKHFLKLLNADRISWVRAPLRAVQLGTRSLGPGTRHQLHVIYLSIWILILNCEIVFEFSTPWNVPTYYPHNESHWFIDLLSTCVQDSILVVEYILYIRHGFESQLTLLSGCVCEWHLGRRRGTRQVFLTRHPSHVIGRPPTYLRCRT